MPHVRVRQVRDAPVAARKLQLDNDGKANRNLRAIWREVLRRYLELGRAPVLVIAQKAVSEWLRGSNLPEGIAVEWFNNVAGLDRYKDVRGLIAIGRTMPKPVAVEALAGALTGRQPQIVERGFNKVVHGVRTRAGARSGIECDVHPDPIAEACRWQICDGQLMQALGRARGVNRTADTPLDIDILANVVLPLTVDEVADWEVPDEGIGMAAEGVILDSGTDMAAAWPDVWPTPGAARNWLLRRAPREGNTVGAYDPSLVPDIRAWLEGRLGKLAGFDFPEPAPQAAAQPADRPPFPCAADIDPGLAAAYRCAVDAPATATSLASVIPETARFDPVAGIAFLPAILDPVERIRLAKTAAAYRSVKANEGRPRHARMRREAAVR